MLGKVMTGDFVRKRDFHFHRATVTQAIAEFKLCQRWPVAAPGALTHGSVPTWRGFGAP